MKSHTDWTVTGKLGAEFRNGIFELRYCKRGEKPDKDTPAPILWNAAVRVSLSKSAYTPQDVADVLERFSNSALAVQARKLGAGVHVFDSATELCAFFARAEGETKKLRALEKAQNDWREKRAAVEADALADFPPEVVEKFMAKYDANNPMPE